MHSSYVRSGHAAAPDSRKLGDRKLHRSRPSSGQALEDYACDGFRLVNGPLTMAWSMAGPLSFLSLSPGLVGSFLRVLLPRMGASEGEVDHCRKNCCSLYQYQPLKIATLQHTREVENQNSYGDHVIDEKQHLYLPSNSGYISAHGPRDERCRCFGDAELRFPCLHQFQQQLLRQFLRLHGANLLALATSASCHGEDLPGDPVRALVGLAIALAGDRVAGWWGVFHG